jgi:hypothetical protein
LEKNQNKIEWDYLSENPSIFYDFYDYEKIKKYYRPINELLIIKFHNPDRYYKYIETGIDELQIYD